MNTYIIIYRVNCLTPLGTWITEGCDGELQALRRARRRIGANAVVYAVTALPNIPPDDLNLPFDDFERGA